MNKVIIKAEHDLCLEAVSQPETMFAICEICDEQVEYNETSLTRHSMTHKKNSSESPIQGSANEPSQSTLVQGKTSVVSVSPNEICRSQSVDSNDSGVATDHEQMNQSKFIATTITGSMMTKEEDIHTSTLDQRESPALLSLSTIQCHSNKDFQHETQVQQRDSRFKVPHVNHCSNFQVPTYNSTNYEYSRWYNFAPHIPHNTSGYYHHHYNNNSNSWRNNHSVSRPQIPQSSSVYPSFPHMTSIEPMGNATGGGYYHSPSHYQNIQSTTNNIWPPTSFPLPSSQCTNFRKSPTVTIPNSIVRPSSPLGSDKIQFTCNLCKTNVFNTSSSLISHQRSYHRINVPQMPVLCPHCQKTYVSDRGLRSHISRCHVNMTRVIDPTNGPHADSTISTSSSDAQSPECDRSNKY